MQTIKRTSATKCICYFKANRKVPITVTARSKVRKVFARSNTGIVSSNPTQRMDVCIYSVFVLGSGLATAGHGNRAV
jgi:hypothetical protein